MRISISDRQYRLADDGSFRRDKNPSPITQENLSIVLQADLAFFRLIGQLKALSLTELRLEVDTELGAVWCFQQHLTRPNFVLPLLKDIRAIQRCLQDFHRDFPREAQRAVRFLVWASDVPGIFNLGGDLKYFLQLIEAGDRTALLAYALACVDVCYTNYCGLYSSVIVAALVTGDALGGGFESALSGDFIVAEEQARFGLPEILYGLYPGMGAYSFLSRRIGQGHCEALIFDGRIREAKELKQFGLIDSLVAAGHGRAAMEKHLAITAQRFDAASSLYNARRRTLPIAYSEMTGITREWVNTALRVSKRDLRKMQKLVYAQETRRANSRAIG